MATVEVEPIGLDRSDLLLVRLGGAVARMHAQALAPTGLKPRQGAALMELRVRGPMSQQALGDAVRTDPSNLVALLNELEDADLVSRRRDPADRRRHIVAITSGGAARLEDAEKALDAVYVTMFAGLDGDERARLHELLTRVATTALAAWAGDDDAADHCSTDGPGLDPVAG